MITIKLNNGTSFEVDNVNENKRISGRYQHRLILTINNGDKEAEYYENLLSAENALNVIAAEGTFGVISFRDFVNISSIDRNISNEGIETRITLTPEGIEE